MAERRMDGVKCGSIEDTIVKDINKTAQPNQKPHDKIVDSPIKEKSKFEKFGSDFVSDVFRPIIGGAVSDIITTIISSIGETVINMIDVKIFGEARHKRGLFNGWGSGFGTGFHTPYNQMASGISMRNVGWFNSGTNSSSSLGYQVKEIQVNTRGEAEILRDTMQETIDIYGVASVADLYQFRGIPTNAMDFKYGWTSFAGAEIRRTLYGGGYSLIVPKPVPIN